MNKNFGTHLPKCFFRGKKGNPGGEKKTQGVGKEIFEKIPSLSSPSPKNPIKSPKLRARLNQIAEESDNGISHFFFFFFTTTTTHSHHHQQEATKTCFKIINPNRQDVSM
jgi:hypothetical protein